MILSPNSPLGFKGRQGAPSTSRWSFLHHRLTRATLHASRRFAAELLHAASSTAAPPTIVFQAAFDNLTRCRIQHGNLLEASVNITAYNNHRSAPFLRALVNKHNQVYSPEGSRRRYLINLSGVTPHLLCTCGVGGLLLHADPI
jgi:hypothetical protein